MSRSADELVARLKKSPDDPAALNALRDTYMRAQDLVSWFDFVERWVRTVKDRARAASTAYEAAELALGRLADRSRAVALYECTLWLDPAHEPASLRLEQIFEEQNDFGRVASVLSARVEHMATAGADATAQAHVHYRLGDLWAQRLHRPDQAVGYFRRAFELDPSFVAAIYAARQIYQAAENYKAASALYDMEINAEQDPARRIALLREAAYVRGDQLGDLEGAVAALKRASALAPNDPAILYDLAAAFRKRADLSALPEVRASDLERASELFLQIASQLPNDQAITYVEAALDSWPQSEAALTALEALANELGQPERLAPRWVNFIAAAPDAKHGRTVRIHLADAYSAAGQFPDAIACLEPLLEQGDASAADRLADLYRRVGRGNDAGRALSISSSQLSGDRRVARLRELVSFLVAEGRIDDAAQEARKLLDVEPADADALALVEHDLRVSQNWTELRDRFLAAARNETVPLDTRRARLREAANLSLQKLNDVDGSLSAWRTIAAQDPLDAEANDAIARVLEQAQRFDELAQHLQQLALRTTDNVIKVTMYRRLIEVQRRRSDQGGLLEAMRDLHQLTPDDTTVRDEFCRILLDAGGFLEAVPLMRRRIETAVHRADRTQLMHELADVLETEIGDDESAFELCTKILDEVPDDANALVRMERIDSQAGNFDRLLNTLSYRAETTSGHERAALFTRMGGIAEHKLNELERAADFYRQAFDLAPYDLEALDAVSNIHIRLGKLRELVTLLRGWAKKSEGRDRAELYRRIARTLATYVGNEEGAAEAWREVLTHADDIEGLEYLRMVAVRASDDDSLEKLDARLLPHTEHSERKRDLLLERGQALGRLGRTNEGIALLKEIIESVDSTHLPAYAELAKLYEAAGDAYGLTRTLAAQLSLTHDPGLRAPVAQKLAAAAHSVSDPAAELEALLVWTQSDREDPLPHRKLIPLLEQRERWEDLLASLDAIAALDKRAEDLPGLLVYAAEIADKRLNNQDGAWSRLEPLFVDGVAEAEVAIRDLAKRMGRANELAELYVRLAQQASGSPAVRLWLEAARLYDEDVQDPAKALEATLRAFALDLANESLLGQVETFAVKASAWQRLAQVYDALIRRADDSTAKASLLLRQSDLLEKRANDPSQALDKLLRACSLITPDADVVARAEHLADRTGRHDHLLVVYERLLVQLPAVEDQFELLMRATNVAASKLDDAEKTTLFLVRAATLTVADLELARRLEGEARALESALGHPNYPVLRALCRAYDDLARRDSTPREASVELWLRAARLLREEAQDASAAMEVLEQATSLVGHPKLLDELEHLGEANKDLLRVDAHLKQLAEEALDATTAAELLRRRGRMLEIDLERYAEAAEVWARLRALSPNDPEARRGLVNCLRRGQKHQDLLLVLERELEKTDDEQARIGLLREIAQTWENGLKNRWEAIEAYERVLKEAPNDEEAKGALIRLEAKKRESAPVEAQEPFQDAATELEQNPPSTTLPMMTTPQESPPNDDTEIGDIHDMLPDLSPETAQVAVEQAPLAPEATLQTSDLPSEQEEMLLDAEAVTEAPESATDASEPMGASPDAAAEPSEPETQTSEPVAAPSELQHDDDAVPLDAEIEDLELVAEDAIEELDDVELIDEDEITVLRDVEEPAAAPPAAPAPRTGPPATPPPPPRTSKPPTQ